MSPRAPEPHAIFFDMDGTLLDFQAGMEESWAAACADGCAKLGAFTPDALFAVVREQRDWFWAHPVFRHTGRMDLDGATRTIVVAAFESLGIDDPETAAAIARYRSRRYEAMRLYPDAIETLERVRDAGMRAALLTNGSAVAQRHSVDRFGLAPYFDCIINEGEFGCGQPDERVFRHALAACGVSPEGAWMVGDNLEADVAPAVALGMHAVWVDAPGGALPDDPPGRPHRTIGRIGELLSA